MQIIYGIGSPEVQFCNSRVVEVITDEVEKSIRDITIHWSLTACNVELS